ncbi:hypothetical protein GWK48_04370 [Metallosphaera tengchongensis]|uniref:Uncharacterized protein n=1 Tax=Metallosphaera tengchongensis TaxID=1532350 RepID=A0A6N0NU90_9CREN|nr:hypothetical protein [Metallosphaera tengchongensis]QKQ99724.1 hypothetical protein GWK48_04370 [Metallosphaera tengchongensis]
MRSDLEIEAPLLLSGLGIQGINNPFLIVKSKFISERVEKPSWWERFRDTFKEATGFSPLEVKLPQIPMLSQYVYGSLIAMEDLANKISLAKNEIWDVLDLIDQALFDLGVLRGMRKVQRESTSILYREGEDPIEVRIKLPRVKFLFKYPLPEALSLDNALTHFAGLITVKMSEGLSDDLIRSENGLWHVIYGLPTPYFGKWKWIWDSIWACLVEFLS